MVDIGERYGTYIMQVVEDMPFHSVIARNGSAELSRVQSIDPHGKLGDPEYWLNTEEGLYVVFSDIGLVNRVEMIRGRKKELVMMRSHYDYFGKGKKKFRYEKVVRIIDDVYKRIEELEFADEEDKVLFNWDGQRIIARFDDYRAIFYSSSDIIAKKADRMMIVKISDKCDRKCLYCTEPAKGGIRLYPEDLIVHNMRLTRAHQHKYHPGLEYLFTEGFLNTADINYFFLKGDTDPAKIIELFYSKFPELEKVYTFMGVPTTLKALSKDPDYLRRLKCAGLNRILVGFETGDNITSQFLGKNETNKQKREAAHAIMSHGFKLSIILQWGMVGQGFYYGPKDDRKFRKIQAIVRNTKELIAGSLEDKVSRGTKARPQVILSQHVRAKGTKLQRLFERGVCVCYETDSRAIWERKSYERFCEKHNIDFELGYETALEDRARTM